jgi:hypothetical protein
MSKLAEYMLVLSEDGAERDSYRADRTAAMTRFGLSDAEQHLVLTGSPAAIRTAIEPVGARPRPVPLQGTEEKPKPKPK